MKKILLILTIIAFPGLVYAVNGCEVVSVSLYNDLVVTEGYVPPGSHVVVGQRVESRPCATVTIKNTSGGGRFDGKIIAKFRDGKTKSQSFKSGRISHGELFTTNICWDGKSQLERIYCEW